MTLNTGYNPAGLNPKILIHDLDGTLKYTYETSQIAASPTQDFTLRTLSVHLGVNDDYGHVILVIDDPNNNLIDTTTSKRTPKIRGQWTLQVYLGKNSSNLHRYFYGIIEDVEVVRPMTNMTQIVVKAAGYGVRLSQRYTSIKRFQLKTADGVTLDTTDNNSRVSEIVKDIIQDTDHLIASGLTAETNITVTGVRTIDIKLPDFQLINQTFATAISSAAGIANALWFVDGDRDLNFLQAGSEDSGFLFTNNPSGTVATGWDADKLGYLKNSSFEWQESSIDGAISILHAFNVNTIAIDVEINPTPNAFFNLTSNWVAVEFTPTQPNIEKISMSLVRTGTPTQDLNVYICGDDASNKPNINDLRAAYTIPASRLTGFATSGRNWVEIGFNVRGGIRISPRERLFVVLEKCNTASHNVKPEYNSGGSNNYYTSSDGTTWGAASTGDFNLRTYANRSVNITLEDVGAKRKYGLREMGFNLRQNIQDLTARELLIYASEIIANPRRTFNKIIVSPFTDKLPLGKYARIEDSFTGLDTYADIIGVDIQLEAKKDGRVGCTSIELTLQEIL